MKMNKTTRRKRNIVPIRIIKHFKTAATQKRGLMFRKTALGKNCGAWFPIHAGGVWMKNTRIPLDAIVIDKNNRALETIQNMTPMSQKVHYITSKKSAGLIETDAGFVDENDIRKGTKLIMN